MPVSTAIVAFFSVLIPANVWVAPDKPMNITVKSGQPVKLVVTDFTGKPVDAAEPVAAADNATVDLKKLFPKVGTPGTYVVWAVPTDQALPQFLGTPLVIQVRNDQRMGADPNDVVVSRIVPLRYAEVQTDQGAMTFAFYYNVAPNTVGSILTLAEQGFYDGLTFHRIVPGFVLQGGDPMGSGKGGPGFMIDAEFNDIKHEAGVLSMARSGDPLEPQGLKPRSEYANSAGSQFFVVLERAEHLDGRYTSFGRVVEGMETVKKLAAVPLANERTGQPQQAPLIQKIEVKPVTPGHNPYQQLMRNFPVAEPAGAEAGKPAANVPQ